MNLVIGITGSIGSGKSTVAKMFEDRGFAVQDADQVVHHIYENHEPTISKIKTEFINCVEDGKVNREKLKQLIKQQPEKKEVLESIVHPAVAAEREEFISKHKKIILDVPLLFEAGVDEFCDVVIITHCPDPMRRKRVLERGATAEIFELLNGSQMSQAEKIVKGDIAIDTSKPLVITKQEVNDIVDDIEEEFDL